MYQCGFEAPNLTTEPDTTSDPGVPPDAPKWDVVRAQEILDARVSIVEEHNHELEAASLQKGRKLRERSLRTTGAEPVDHDQDPHRSAPPELLVGHLPLVPRSIL